MRKGCQFQQRYRETLCHPDDALEAEPQGLEQGDNLDKSARAALVQDIKDGQAWYHRRLVLCYEA